MPFAPFVAMHLFLVANLVTTSKALVTRSDALVTSSVPTRLAYFQYPDTTSLGLP